MFLVNGITCILSEGVLGFRFTSIAWFIQYTCCLYVAIDLLYNGFKNSCGLTFWLVSHFNWIPSGQMRAGEPVELLSSALIGLLQNKQENCETKIIHLKLIKAITRVIYLNRSLTVQWRPQALLSCHGWWVSSEIRVAGGDWRTILAVWDSCQPL